MHKDIVVRMIKPDEVNVLFSAYMAISKDDNKKESARRYVNMTFFDIFKRGEAMAWVAEVDGNIAGVLVLRMEEHTYETPDRFIVGDLMYVKRKYRSFGVAKKLAETVFPIINKSGITRVKMAMFDNNKEYNKMLEDRFGLKKAFTVYEWRKPSEEQKSL